MSAENVETLVKAKTFWNLQAKKQEKKKAHGRETTKKKLQKKLKKRYEGFDPVETPANPRANLLVQDKKEFEG